MKLIPLTQGKFAKVDDEDYDYLMQWKWQARKPSKECYSYYGKRRRDKKTEHIYLHREIMKAPKNRDVDHADGDGLNCQKYNLRICSETENARNRIKRNLASSKYKGVYWCKSRNRWRPSIMTLKRRVYFGRFINEDDAARAYNKKAIELFGEFANLNII